MSETTPANVNYLNHPDVSKAHLETVLSNIRDLIITLDYGWRYTYINHRMLELSGMNREDILGKSIWELFPDTIDTLLYQEMHRAAAEQKPVQFEYLYPAWNQWFECRVYPSENGISLLLTDITERKQAEQRRNIQYAVARILAEASTSADALAAILQALCESLGWQLATLWSVDDKNNCLYYSDSWRSPTSHAQALIDTNQQTTFAPGVGLPGRVWMQGQPLWISDLSKDSNFPRMAVAKGAGLQAIFGFPILSNNNVLGVIECFCDRVQEVDEDLLNMMAAIGFQIGQFMERKRTEAALQESQELFESFMKHSPMAAFIKDENGRYLYVNSKVERFYQRSRSELIGKTDFELLPSKIAQQFQTNDVAVLTSGQPMQVLETIQQKDREQSYMSFKFPFCNAAGQQLLAGVMLDISEQIQAEETLRQSEERLRIAQQAANAGVWDWDIVTNQVTWSEEYYRLYGLDPAITQPSYENWLGSILDKDRDRVEQAARKALEQGIDLNVEFRILHPTQGERWLTAIGQTFYDERRQPQRMTGIALDITERKLAEEALRKSEERYRKVHDQVIVGLSQADLTGRFMEVNERFCEIVGRSTEELLNLRMQDITHPDDLPGNVPLYQRMLTEGVSFEIEKRYIRPDGSIVWVRNHVSPIKDTAGRPLHAVAVTEDITERKLAEEALQKSEERYRKIHDQVIIGISQVDLAGRFIEVNERFCEIVGRSPAQLLTLRMQDITHPDDLPQNIPLFKRMQAEGASFEIEKRYIRPDGSVVWVRNYVSLIRDAAGQPQYSVAVTEDITERKRVKTALAKSNQTLQAIIQACPLAIMGLRADGSVRIWNPAAERIFGWTQQEVLGKFLPTIPAHKQNEVLNNIAATLEGQVLAGVETQRQTKANELIDVALWSAPVDETQAGISYLSIVADITARKQAEAALRQSEAFNRQILESSEDCIKVLDLEGLLLYMSPGGQTLLEVDDITPLLQRSWVGFWQEADRPAAQETLNRARAGGVGTFQGYCPTLVGEPKWWDVRITPIRGADGQVERLLCISRDITERKLSEEALRESEERLRLALTAANQGLYDLNVQTGETIVSPEYAQMLGYDPQEFQETNALWRDRLHPDDVAEVYQVYEDYIAGKLDTYRVEFRQRTKSGDWKWILSIGKIVTWDSNGQPLRMLGTHTDITERKLSEEALRQSEERLRLALEGAELGTWDYDLGSGQILWSDRTKVMAGVALDTKVDFEFFMNAAHPDDRQRIQEAAALALAQRTDYDVESRSVWADGTVRWLRSIGRAYYDGQGTPIRMAGVVMDITERKLSEAALRTSEERYRYLAESIPQLVWTSNATGVLIDVNQRWSNFTGLTLAQAQTEGWQAIIHPEDLPILTENWAIAQRNGTYYQAQGRIRRADGTYRWHLHQAVPLKDEQNQLIKWFGTATDIEAQKQLEQQRIHLLQQEQAAREQAEAANRIKDEFLAVLSHELRSPLNPILGWAKLLQSRRFDDKTFNKAIETIERNARLQSQLIEDLLDVSRILQGKLSLNMAFVHLAPALESALETVRLAAEAKHIQIQTYYDSSIETVLGDSARLQQIVWNLLSNAIKFTPEGGKVEIRLERADKQDKGDMFHPHQSPVTQYAQITVKDTGRGISADFLPYVFDYFRQADSTTTRKFGGLGLGLAIVRHLVELHGGTVWADSPGEEQGATFTVKLPLQTESKALSGAPTVDAIKNVSATLPLTGINILVVEDEEDNRDFLAFVLEQAGASVTVAASAYQALEILTQSKPDILISDIGMPEMDGYTLLWQVRKLEASRGANQIPAIALTAYVGEINQKQALAAGFQQHISKPLNAEQLLMAILKLTNQKSG